VLPSLLRELQARHFHIVHVVPVGAKQRPCADRGIECCNPTHGESSALLGFAGGAQAATLVGNSISAEFDGIGTVLYGLLHSKSFQQPESKRLFHLAISHRLSIFRTTRPENAALGGQPSAIAKRQAQSQLPRNQAQRSFKFCDRLDDINRFSSA